MKNNVTGEKYSTTLHLNYSGRFGFKATLTVPLRKQDAGLYANLFYYDPVKKALEFVASALIDENGNAEFDFDQTSDYAIVVDDHPYNGSKNTADEEDIRDNDIDSIVDSSADVNPHTGVSGSFGLLAVCALAAGAAIALKKRKK